MAGAEIRYGEGGRTLLVGCGFIGSHVVERLARGGRPPVVLTRSRPSEEVAALIEEPDLRIGDAADPEALADALNGVGSVIFAAGGLLPAASEQDPELDARLTLGPVEATLEALRERPGVELLYISSGGTVYGEPERVPVDEGHPTHPRGTYGQLHLACERAVERERLEHGLPARILRCATVYGERQRPDRGQGAVVTFLHRVERGESIDLYGKGTTVRDYIYAGDVAEACAGLLGRDEGPPILNVGTGTGTSLFELLHMVEDHLGRRAKIVEHPERSFEVRQVVLDPTELRRIVEIDFMPLPAGIARTHEWLSSAVVETT